jgi:hypothetical protein
MDEKDGQVAHLAIVPISTSVTRLGTRWDLCDNSGIATDRHFSRFAAKTESVPEGPRGDRCRTRNIDKFAGLKLHTRRGREGQYVKAGTGGSLRHEHRGRVRIEENGWPFVWDNRAE